MNGNTVNGDKKIKIIQLWEKSNTIFFQKLIIYFLLLYIPDNIKNLFSRIIKKKEKNIIQFFKNSESGK